MTFEERIVELCKAKNYKKALDTIINVLGELEIINNKFIPKENRIIVYACHYGYKNIVETLIDQKCISRYYYQESLLVSCMHRHFEIAEIIIKNGTNGTRVNDSLLCKLCKRISDTLSLIEVLNFLFKYIDKTRINGYFLFVSAMREHNCIDLLKCLIDNGVDINYTHKIKFPIVQHITSYEMTPLIQACISNKKDIVELYLNAGAKVDLSVLFVSRNRPFILNTILKHTSLKTASTIFPLLHPDSDFIKKLGKDLAIQILSDHFGSELVIMPNRSPTALLVDIFKMKHSRKRRRPDT